MAVREAKLKLGLIDNISAGARRINGALDSLQRRTSPLNGTFGRIAAFGATYLGVTEGFQQTYVAAADAQTAMTNIGVKANLTGGQLEMMHKRLTTLSTSTNQLTSDLTSGVDVMLGMGLGADDAMGSIGAVGKAATATGASMADLSAASVSAMQNLKVAPSEISRMLDGMAYAGNQGAFELKDMAQYIPALGAAYQGLGQTGVGAVNDLASALQIMRQGTGDSASAAGNLGNVLQKIAAPQTRAAFKKLGVNLSKEMAKATAKGMSPIEAIAEITNKTLKGDLSKLGDLFADSEVQKGLRPLIQNMAEFRRIRDEANRATGTIADAYGRQMDTANQKVKHLSISLSNLSTSIGDNLLRPVSDSADELAHIFDTLDKRATVFDRIGAAAGGFLNGAGMGDTGFSKAAQEWKDFLFGIEDGSKSADQIGGIFVKFQKWGTDIRWFTDAMKDSPVGKFFADMAPYAVKAWIWGAGISFLAGTIGALAASMYKLSGASTIVAALKAAGTIADVVSGGTFPKGGTNPKGNGPTDSKNIPPVTYWAGLTTWLKGLSVAGAPGVMSEAMSFTPGDTLEDQIRLQAAYRKDILWYSDRLARLFGGGGNDNSGHPYTTGGDGSVSVRPGQVSPFFEKPADDGSVSIRRQVVIDPASISQMTQPRGVQQVQVMNQQPVSVPVYATFNITGVSDPKAAGDQAASQLGAKVKASVEASFGGGGF